MKRQGSIDESTTITIGHSGRITYGAVIRYTRTLHGINVDHVGVLYGKIAGGSPVTGRHVQRMEQTDTFFPKDSNHTRRWLLARLLRVPPALIALVGINVSAIDEHSRGTPFLRTAQSVDIEEYYLKLKKYWLDGHVGEGDTQDIQTRIDRLHDKVLYVDDKQQQEMIQLLCGYQLLIANIAHEQRDQVAAERYLTNAVILARDKECYELLVHALNRRQSFYLDTGKYTLSLADFEMARSLGKYIPPQLQGKFFSGAGEAQARLAESKEDFILAMRYQDIASKKIGKFAPDNFLFLASFDEERYVLDRAATLMASPNKRLRSPQTSQDQVDHAIAKSEMRFFRISNYRQAYRDLIQAKIFCDQGYYEVAATSAESALSALQDLKSTVHVDDIALLAHTLREKIPYSLEMGSLELELTRMQSPYLFN
jgi:hypothetical protein